MTYIDFNCFKVSVDGAIAEVMIDHPPINLMDMTFIGELYTLTKALAADDDVKVIVFRSADPDFFVSHADLKPILSIKEHSMDPTRLSLVNKSIELLRTMPKVSIAVIEGQTQGGGSELTLGMDMRFAAINKARFGQPEAALGIIPGGGGSVRLPEMMGRGRALEVLLGCQMFSAEEAALYGWVNRALPAETINSYVDDLARRIASCPKEVIAAVKELVNSASNAAMESQLLKEQNFFAECAGSEEGQRRMRKALSLGLQEREVELEQFDKVLMMLSET